MATTTGITSRFPGHCASCHRSYEAGTQVIKWNGTWCHAICPAQSSHTGRHIGAYANPDSSYWAARGYGDGDLPTTRRR